MRQQEEMCGRSACARNGRQIQCSCAYRKKGSKEVVKPAWVPSTKEFYPSYNISPQTNTPVLISGNHSHAKTALAADQTNDDLGKGSADATICHERVLQVMKWGLVPSWQKEPRSRLLNNCRYEGLMDKPSFRNAIYKRQRCVVLVDGFFEWNSKKQPFFAYFKENGPTAEMLELATHEESSSNGVKMEEGKEEEVLKSRMLTMAGLFDICNSPHLEEAPLFTYTVITVAANDHFGAIHHRMPAILENEDAVSKWLDTDLSTDQALQVINPIGSEALSWHPVSTKVNNVRNKSPENIVKIDLDKPPSKKGTLHNWFSSKSAAPKPEPPPQAATIKEEEKEPDSKKLKLQ